MTINEKIVILANMNKKSNSAEQIIDRFGGQSALAGLLGRRQSTIQHWATTGIIPSQWHEPLLKLTGKKELICNRRTL